MELHNRQIERQLLAALMSGADFFEVQGIVRATDFSDKKNIQLFRKMQANADNDEPIEPGTLLKYTDLDPQLITEIYQSHTVAANATVYAKVVRQCSQKRFLNQQFRALLARLTTIDAEQTLMEAQNVRENYERLYDTQATD